MARIIFIQDDQYALCTNLVWSYGLYRVLIGPLSLYKTHDVLKCRGERRLNYSLYKYAGKDAYIVFFFFCMKFTF